MSVLVFGVDVSAVGWRGFGCLLLLMLMVLLTPSPCTPSMSIDETLAPPSMTPTEHRPTVYPRVPRVPARRDCPGGSFDTLNRLLKETFPLGDFPVALYVSTRDPCHLPRLEGFALRRFLALAAGFVLWYGVMMSTYHAAVTKAPVFDVWLRLSATRRPAMQTPPPSPPGSIHCSCVPLALAVLCT